MSNAPLAFLDVNIFIDILQKRRSWQNSLNIINAVRTGRIKGAVSPLTVSIIYFLRKNQGLSERKARQDVRDSIKGFYILGMDQKQASAALDDNRFSDFEDSMQYHCAKAGNADALVTRNIRDFSKVTKDMEVLTPEDFIKKYRL